MTFTESTIVGLFKIRNTYPETREWLRQVIRLERKRREGT